MAEETNYSKGYGKRPFWQWVVLYLIIGGIIYAAVYYFFLAPKGGYNTSQGGTPYNYTGQ